MSGKRIGIIVALLLLVIFTLQNYQVAQIRLLFWTIRSSTALLVFVSCLIGFLVGILLPHNGGSWSE